MGDVKNLNNRDAIEKIKEFAEKVNICMFCTKSDELPFETRPMSTQEVDKEGNIWFMSSAESNKNFEIKQDDKVQLIYSQSSDSHYIVVYGEADVIRDQKKIDELWNFFTKAWFEKGKNDPNITLIKVRPLYAYYWDTKHGKIVTLLKVAAAAISGSSMDDGVEGSLKI